MTFRGPVVKAAAWVVLSIGIWLSLAACQESERPTNVQIVTLRGSPYERGFQHGRQLSAHIRSLYTKLLASSILPFLNREQLNIAPILPIYGQPGYLDGAFSFRMILESGQYLYDNYLPEDYKQELHGVADGAGMDFEEILVLNTFFDTMLGFRAIVMFIQGIQEPYIASFSVLDGLASDSRDNDGDGLTDEVGEGIVEPYQPLPHASLVEVPVDSQVRIVLEDPTLPGLACIDPRNIEPLADKLFSRDCVLADCLRTDCHDQELVGRDCFSASSLSCIDPRVDGACIDPDCVEPTDPACVDPNSIRLILDGQLFTNSDPALEIRQLPFEGDDPPVDPESPYYEECFGPLEVLFTSPGGFTPASTVTLVVQAGDRSPIYSPAPLHSRFMRDERIVFTTQGWAAQNGTGDTPFEIQNRGPWDPNKQPPSIGFAVRGSATPDGEPLLAHHYALLDSDMVHEHSVLFVHIPDDGHAHAMLSWAGVIWGFSGMNVHGLTYAINNSDTLDNALVGGVLAAMFEPENLAYLIQNPDLEGLAKALADTQLFAAGLPVGITGREMLTRSTTVAQGQEFLYRNGSTYGWNFLLADASGDMVAVELDSASQAEESGQAPAPVDEDGFFFYGPDPTNPINLDPRGQAFGSVGPDDLRLASHYQKNTEDMEELSLLGIFSPRRQRYWSRFYYRSLRAFYVLGEQIDAAYGSIDRNRAIEILRTPELVDTRDSMNACIYEPSSGRFHWAMGGVPATDQPFVEFDLVEHVASGGDP